MNRFVAAAAMWGLALGAVAYRYAVLPFDWSSGWKHVLPGAAIGLAIAARQLVRDGGDGHEVKRPGLPIMLGLGAVAALIAFGLAYLAFPTLDRARLARHEFPGFSLAVPDGDVIEDRHDYATGKWALKNAAGANGVAIVAWDIGEGMTKNDLQLVGELLVKAIGAGGASSSMTSVAGPDGHPVETIVFAGDVTMQMSVLRCGGRNVVVATGGRDRAMSLHERVIASFICKPDPAREATAAMTFPLVMDLPGWYVTERQPDSLQITDGVTGLTMRTQDRDLKVDLALIIEPTFKAVGLDGKITSRAGDRVNLTISDGKDEMAGWARLVPCPTGTAFMIALGPDQGKLDELYNRVSSARCLRAGEAPQQWPAAPAAAPSPQ